MLLLQLRLRGGGKTKTRSSTARKRQKKARWAGAADRLARRGHAIELDADGLPRIARPPRRATQTFKQFLASKQAKQGKAPLKQKMVLRLRPGCEW